MVQSGRTFGRGFQVPVYCLYGSRKRTVFKDTEVPVPDVVQISTQLLADIGLLVTGTQWLAPFLDAIIGRYITTEAFCLHGPYPLPKPLGLDTLARLPTWQLLLMEWFNYYFWEYACECIPGGGDCEVIPYHGTETEFPAGTIGLDVVGAETLYYDVTIYSGDEVVSEYFAWEGPIGVYWDYPEEEGGIELNGRRRCRAWWGVTDVNAGTGVVTRGGTIFDADSNNGFPDIANWTVVVCPHDEGPPPIDPPLPTLPDNPGLPEPVTVTCSTLDDVCAALDRLRTLVRFGALGYIGSSLTPAGEVVMTGDGHSPIIADAIKFHVEEIPTWANRTGTDTPYIYEMRGQNAIGWWAAGSDDAWYDRHYIHYQDQHSGLLPADVTQLTWSLGAQVTVTAQLYVRQG